MYMYVFVKKLSNINQNKKCVRKIIKITVMNFLQSNRIANIIARKTGIVL